MIFLIKAYGMSSGTNAAGNPIPGAVAFEAKTNSVAVMQNMLTYARSIPGVQHTTLTLLATGEFPFSDAVG